MRIESYEFTGANAVNLPAMLWLPDCKPLAILQITHGMTEHIGRYESFAAEMTARGCIIVGYDLRGHGRNAGRSSVASFGEDGWDASLEDMRLFFDHLAARFPSLPHYMLGFSLGSFLLREYLSKWPQDVSGAIIMGTGYQPAPLLSLMMAVVRGQIRKAGFDHTTDLVRQLSFGAYNQKFKPSRTASDWLCSDPMQLDLYLSDPLCRRDISSGLFYQLLASMKRTGTKDACAAWNQDMPVLLISGQNDPVGNSGKGVQTVKNQMTAAGLSVSLELIPGARHDLLHEAASGAADRVRRAVQAFCLPEPKKT